MNLFIFLFVSIGICAFSIIVLSVGPFVNKVHGKDWGYKNCAIFGDKAEDNSKIFNDLIFKKHLCQRQKVTHDLEYTSFIIDIILSFVCADLALLHFMKIGEHFQKNTGLIGMICGGIGFILTLTYISFSGYLFTKDTAYLELNFDTSPGSKVIEKLYSNGAEMKYYEYTDGSGIYESDYKFDKDRFANLIKYKDLGKKQYNYRSGYYKKYYAIDDSVNEIFNCKLNYQLSLISTQKEVLDNTNVAAPFDYEMGVGKCNYLYSEPYEKNINLYLFNRWLTALIFACFVMIGNIAQGIYGFFLFTSASGNASL